MRSEAFPDFGLAELKDNAKTNMLIDSPFFDLLDVVLACFGLIFLILVIVLCPANDGRRALTIVLIVGADAEFRKADCIELLALTTMRLFPLVR